MAEESKIDVAVVPSESSSALKTIVAELQAEVRKLKTEMKQFTKNQIVLQAEIQELTANQNSNNATTKNNPTTTTNSTTRRAVTSTPDNCNHADGTRYESNNDIANKTIMNTTIQAISTTSRKIDTAIKRISNQSSNTQRTVSITSLNSDRAIHRFSDQSLNARVTMSGEIYCTEKDNTIVNISDASSTNDGNNYGSNYDDGNNYDDDDDDDDEVDVKRYLFTNSTHRYLFMNTIERPDGTNYKVGWNHKILAFLVVLFQSFAYLVFGYLTARDYQSGKEEWMNPTIQLVDPTLCYDTDEYPDDPIWAHYHASASDNAYSNLGQAINASECLPLEMIKCSDPTDLFNDQEDVNIGFLVGPTACWTLAFFLLPDLYESFILIVKCKHWRDKLVGTLFLSKAVLATVVGSIGFTNAFFTRASDTFLLIVGLIFVHEVDEQFGYMEEIIERTREKQYFRVTLQFGCFWWFVYYPIYMGIVMLYCNYIIDLGADVGLLVGGGFVQAGIFFAFAFAVNALARCGFKRKAAIHTPAI